MQTEIQNKHKVSTHLRELLRLDVNSLVDTCAWLEKNALTNRDQANRRANKRLVARLMAARIAMKACEGDIPAAKEVMDRTEGKVVDVVMAVDGNRLIEQLEAGRQRVLAGYQPQQMVVEGETVVAEPTVVGATSTEPTTSNQLTGDILPVIRRPLS